MLFSITPEEFRMDDGSGQMQSADTNTMFVMLPCTRDCGVM